MLNITKEELINLCDLLAKHNVIVFGIYYLIDFVDYFDNAPKYASSHTSFTYKNQLKILKSK